nr:metal ABC transporter ATP-binding protein [Synechococcus sp. PCC 7502]
MLEVQELSVNYRGLKALEAINFQIHRGQVVGIIGPNGAGKSTLFKALLGLIPLLSGQVTYNGKLLSRQKQRVAYVPQRSQIDWDYPVTVWNVVMMARTTYSGWFHNHSRRSQEIVREALQKVEMLHLSDRRISDLSGGQQQRVFLARALAQEVDLFLLDEPLAGVDKKTEELILEIYRDLKAQGKTLLVSCHEWGQTLDNYDQLLLLNQSLIAYGSPQEVMTLENIQSAYGSSQQVRRLVSPLEAVMAC